jgi:hypothetical protein
MARLLCGFVMRHFSRRDGRPLLGSWAGHAAGGQTARSARPSLLRLSTAQLLPVRGEDLELRVEMVCLLLVNAAVILYHPDHSGAPPRRAAVACRLGSSKRTSQRAGWAVQRTEAFLFILLSHHIYSAVSNGCDGEEASWGLYSNAESESQSLRHIGLALSRFPISNILRVLRGKPCTVRRSTTILR